jgi:hypothetical protein
MNTTQKRYTKKNGEVKYYATYGTAWNAAIRLNETAVDGTWLFEGDEHGWYLHFENEMN